LVGVKTPPPPELLVHEALKTARLADALTLLASEHAAQDSLSEAAVVGAFCWVVGSIIGTTAREGRGELEQLLAFLGQQVRRRAVSEMARRSYSFQ